MEKRIVCIGDLFGDVVIPYGTACRYIELLERDQATMVPPQVELHPGGSMPTTASLLGLRGKKPLFVGRIGSDPIGKTIRGDLGKFGVDTDLIRPQKEGTVLVLAVAGADGERVFFTWAPPGTAFGTLTEEDLSEKLLQKACHVHSGGMMVKDGGERAQMLVSFFERCKAAGVATSFDFNLRCETFPMTKERKGLCRRLAECVTVLFISGADEMAPLTGCSDLAKGAKQLAKEDNTVVVRDGGNPLIVYHRGQRMDFPVLPVHVVNKIGAGDAFNAGFLDAKYDGEDLRECVFRGNAFAAHVIGGNGTRSVPSKEELDQRRCEWMERMI